MDYENQIDILQVESLPEQYADSATIKLSGEKKRKISARLKQRLEDLKADRRSSGWERTKEADFNSYHMVAPKKALPYVGYPNLACPLTRIGVDTFHANVLFTFGGQNGRFTVLPELLSRSHMDSAERGAKYLTYVLNYESGLYSALDKADHNANQHDKGYLEARYCKEYVWETRWVTSTETVPEINELTGEVTPKEVKRKKKERLKKCTFDGIKIESIDPECILRSPFIEDLEDAVKHDVVFKVKAYTQRFLDENSRSYDKDIDPYFDATAVKRIRDSASADVSSQLEKAKKDYDGYQLDAKVDTMPVELAEAHFWEDINGDGFAEKITVIFETASSEILRTTYGECRIVELKPRPIAGRADGQSVRQTSASIIDEWEAIHNARVAKGQWANLPIIFYRAGGRFNPQTQTLIPGKAYPVDDPSSVTSPQFGQVDISYFNEEKILLDYFERIMALGDSIQGVVSKGDQTATESINAQQRAGIRLSTPINRIANSLNKLVGHIWELNKQCAPEEKEFMVAGIGDGTPVFDKITSKDYDTLVSYRLNLATMFDVQMVRDSAMMNYKIFMADPQVMNNPAAMYENTRRLMKATSWELNIPKPEQAYAQSPFLKIDLLKMGKPVEPKLGEDTTEALIAYDAVIRSDDFKEWRPEHQKAFIVLRDKTQMQQMTLQAANLNQSGIFEGMGPQGTPMPPQQGLTVSKNPSETMNRLKIGEGNKSAQANVKNAMTGGMQGGANA